MPFPDDEIANYEFVLAVEDNPVLYNSNLKEYSNRHEQDKAWKQIAKKFNSSETECRIRWRTIRGGFTRYLKSQTKGNGPKKPYYLWNNLQFLLPFTKKEYKLQSTDLDSSKISEQDEAEDGVEEEQQEDPWAGTAPYPTKERTPTPTTFAGNSSLITTSFSSAWQNSSFGTVTETLEDSQQKATHFVRKRRRKDTSSADLDFFKSILPDIDDFTPATKRRFKRKVLELIDELAGENVSSSSHSYSTRHIYPGANAQSETEEED